MKSAEGSLGRVFVLRLEDGDRLPECIERFAAANGVKRAYCAMLGGVGAGSIVAGPEDGSVLPPRIMLEQITGVHEAAAVGLIAPDESGAPRLHMHAVFGRGGTAKAGCIRPGIDIWTIGEFVLMELSGLDLVRRRDPATGFELLSMD